MCLYINLEWCAVIAIVFKHCSSLRVAISTAVTVAVCESCTVASAINKHPYRFFIITGILSHANLKAVLLNFHQYVSKFATRGENTLDLVCIQVIFANVRWCSLLSLKWCGVYLLCVAVWSTRNNIYCSWMCQTNDWK